MYKRACSLTGGHRGRCGSLQWWAALTLFLSAAVNAQQTAPPVQQVPDNVAPHPAPVQPIAYSHKQHLALGLQCSMCHTNPDPGAAMGYPASSTCMSCHAGIATDKPDIIKLATFAAAQQPIPWARVYEILKGVNWSHRVHTAAGLPCESCHGDVRQLAAMAEITAVTAMASCIDCHRAHEADTGCTTCHAWPVPELAHRER